MQRLLVINKKALIETIIAGMLLIGELIWALVYRFGGYVWIDYVELSMSKLVAVFLNIDLLCVIIILLINSKSKNNNRIFEVFVAVLLLAVQAIVALWCRFSADKWDVRIVRYFVRLLEIFVIINALYIIVFQIINSDIYRLCKTVIAVLILLVELGVFWIHEYFSTITSETDELCSHIIIIAVFASVNILYAVSLKIFDVVRGIRLKSPKDNATVYTPKCDKY